MEETKKMIVDFMNSNKYRMMNPIVLCCYLIIFMITSSCIKIEDFSEIPQIKFQSAKSDIAYDALGNKSKHTKLTFKVVDGNGDIGLKPSDTLPPYVGDFQHNFYFDLMVKKQGKFSQWNDLIINNFNIPYIKPQGQNKLVDARVSIDLYFPIALMPYDTVYYRFYIYDRALNRSNTDTSHIVVFL